jgi:TolB protein
LASTGQPLFWAWSPSGDRLLIHTNINTPAARLAFLDPTTAYLGENMAQPGAFQAPGIAPDGRFWAFANQLAFISPAVSVQRFYGPLRLLDIANKAVDTLVEATVLAFFWAPDGQKIAYFTLAETLSPAPNLASPTANGRTNGIYRPTHSGLQAGGQATRLEALLLDLGVVNISTRQQRKLATFEPDTYFINQFLPFFDQYALSHRLWSPASDALVLPAVTGDISRISVVTIAGGSPQPLAEGHMAFWSWQ